MPLHSTMLRSSPLRSWESCVHRETILTNFVQKCYFLLRIWIFTIKYRRTVLFRSDLFFASFQAVLFDFIPFHAPPFHGALFYTAPFHSTSFHSTPLRFFPCRCVPHRFIPCRCVPFHATLFLPLRSGVSKIVCLGNVVDTKRFLPISSKNLTFTFRIRIFTTSGLDSLTWWLNNVLMKRHSQTSKYWRNH